MSDLKRQIRQIALNVGFTEFGVARAVPLEKEKVDLDNWLKEGYNGSMAWMEKNSDWRTDPTSYFPGAKSVISLGLNYYKPHQHSGDITKGKISRYAWGEDYHKIISEKLELMLKDLNSIAPEARFKPCCDTAPIMEKTWAAKAGIGWIGKNTNLITKGSGSWLFLAEIITDLEIEEDSESLDYCGSCTLCLDTCPTDALIDAYKIDSQKCISYLTIEHKGEFTIDTPDLDGWIYGCDICQDVCPWNNFQINTDERRFEPKATGVEIDIDFASGISDSEFRDLFKDSPIKRTKSTGLRRNANQLKLH